jgi:hypothetical protein
MRIRLRTALIAVVALMLLAGCNPAQQLKGKSKSTPSPAAPSVTFTPHIVWKTDQTIKPTAIVLHWWDGWGGGDNINALVNGANSNYSTYNPALKSTDRHPSVGHTTVQIGITGNGTVYQLTPSLNSFARHAKCANTWAIGIEIEGYGPGHSHYIGNDQTQLNSVVATVKTLMSRYHIPAKSVVASDGRSGQGIVSHKMVDQRCKWADNKPAGTGKEDVDDQYLHRVLQAVGG